MSITPPPVLISSLAALYRAAGSFCSLLAPSTVTTVSVAILTPIFLHRRKYSGTSGSSSFAFGFDPLFLRNLFQGGSGTPSFVPPPLLPDLDLSFFIQCGLASPSVSLAPVFLDCLKFCFFFFFSACFLRSHSSCGDFWTNRVSLDAFLLMLFTDEDIPSEL